MPIDLYLASRSPRRRELLDQAGYRFELVDAPVDETPFENEQPLAYVERLAQSKAAAGAKMLCSEAASTTAVPVLGADTSVVAAGRILGKPVDREHAIEMLSLLSGAQHEVCTGIALHDGVRVTSAVSRSVVWFRQLSSEEIERYWASNEPQDKAGAYAIQGKAGVFVERIEGSYSGIVGLPLFELDQMLINWPR